MVWRIVGIGGLVVQAGLWICLLVLIHRTGYFAGPVSIDWAIVYGLWLLSILCVIVPLVAKRFHPELSRFFNWQSATAVAVGAAFFELARRGYIGEVWY